MIAGPFALSSTSLSRAAGQRLLNVRIADSKAVKLSFPRIWSSRYLLAPTLPHTWPTTKSLPLLSLKVKSYDWSIWSNFPGTEPYRRHRLRLNAIDSISQIPSVPVVARKTEVTTAWSVKWV